MGIVSEIKQLWVSGQGFEWGCALILKAARAYGSKNGSKSVLEVSWRQLLAGLEAERLSPVC